jgi:hypothetical protein
MSEGPAPDEQLRVARERIDDVATMLREALAEDERLAAQADGADR